MPLIIHVACAPCSVRLVEAPLIGHSGNEVMARVNLGRRETLISTACPPKGRLDALGVAVADTWIRKVGRPSGIAGVARLIGMIAVSVTRDVEAGGGILALEMLHTGESDAPSPERLTGSLVGPAAEVLRQCSVCATRIAPGDVRVGGVRRDPKLGAPVIDLEFDCEHCGDVERITELANGAGRPSGQRVGYARIGQHSSLVILDTA